MLHRSAVFQLSCVVALTLVLSTDLVAQVTPIRGFPQDALAEQARLEQMLRSTPDTALLNEYLRTMSEEPHHAGSPGSRAVAEYALEK